MKSKIVPVLTFMLLMCVLSTSAQVSIFYGTVYYTATDSNTAPGTALTNQAIPLAALVLTPLPPRTLFLFPALLSGAGLQQQQSVGEGQAHRCRSEWYAKRIQHPQHPQLTLSSNGIHRPHWRMVWFPL